MSPEDQAALAEHSREIARILHRNSSPEAINTLEGIERTVRQQMLEYVSPEVGIFLSKPVPKPDADGLDTSKVS